MHPGSTVRAALELADAGANATEIARHLNVPRRTISDWLMGARPHSARPGGCGQCFTEHRFADLSADYVYLLGLYLGDGCISAAPRGVYKLRIVLDVKYPRIIDSATAAMSSVRGRASGTQTRPRNCVEVYSYWKCWPCLFPQHGPGKKHERQIVLTDWQQELMERWPDQLLRGLIESDGCRFQNTGRRWSWPRYSFRNHSADICSIFCRACECMDLRWTASGRYTIYVSRKADVATLDRFIGPKT